MAKIMVIDDEPDIILLIKHILKRAGHEIIGAESGEVALNKLKDEKPDLILLDIMMPVMHGWKTLEKIRKIKDSEDIPVVILTAGAITFELFKRSDLNEFVDYIAKPFKWDSLIEKVDEILENQRKIHVVKDRLMEKGFNPSDYMAVARGENICRTLIETMMDLLERKAGTSEELKSFARIIEKEEKIAESLKRRREEVEKKITGG